MNQNLHPEAEKLFAQGWTARAVAVHLNESSTEVNRWRRAWFREMVARAEAYSKIELPVVLGQINAHIDRLLEACERVQADANEAYKWKALTESLELCWRARARAMALSGIEAEKVAQTVLFDVATMRKELPRGTSDLV